MDKGSKKPLRIIFIKYPKLRKIKKNCENDVVLQFGIAVSHQKVIKNWKLNLSRSSVIYLG